MTLKRIVWVLVGLIMIAGVVLLLARQPMEEHWAGLEVTMNRLRWKSQDIHDYEITVTVASMWHIQSAHLVVRGDRVIEFAPACDPAPLEFGECEVHDVNPDDYTIAGLFSRLANANRQERLRLYRTQYDSDYGFPRSIRFDDPQLIDEEFAIQASEFRPSR